MLQRTLELLKGTSKEPQRILEATPLDAYVRLYFSVRLRVERTTEEHVPVAHLRARFRLSSTSITVEKFDQCQIPRLSRFFDCQKALPSEML